MDIISICYIEVNCSCQWLWLVSIRKKYFQMCLKPHTMT